ncbi:hypothetical protein ADUPG1_007673 [Aduncisulcus paluster]|uniref:Uncharacterized protein n=1 Tax=Aduncisulcus paluster TaxID=2918883 RepID=A0ABQ5KP96_9EUKA|nr:hypothetical protein ADUPG1_007673 [Aduncisulcus paluster]
MEDQTFFLSPKQAKDNLSLLRNACDRLVYLKKLCANLSERKRQLDKSAAIKKKEIDKLDQEITILKSEKLAMTKEIDSYVAKTKVSDERIKTIRKDSFGVERDAKAEKTRFLDVRMKTHELNSRIEKIRQRIMSQRKLYEEEHPKLKEEQDALHSDSKILSTLRDELVREKKKYHDLTKQTGQLAANFSSCTTSPFRRTTSTPKLYWTESSLE